MRNLALWSMLALLHAGISPAHAIGPFIRVPPVGSSQRPPGTPIEFVNSFYELALLIAGLLAFAMIIYGAIKYSVSGGNSALQNDAKDQIKQALLGLLLLVGAYVILKIINPNLTTLTLPNSRNFNTIIQ